MINLASNQEKYQEILDLNQFASNLKDEWQKRERKVFSKNQFIDHE